MGPARARARWGSDGAILAPRWAIAHVTGRYPGTVARHCAPVACDVHTKALLYDVDAAHAVLEGLLPGTPRGKNVQTLASDLGQAYGASH
jgi:hypothetical protein